MRAIANIGMVARTLAQNIITPSRSRSDKDGVKES
jgi:hypothetical protein